jgi:hypothetical protein
VTTEFPDERPLFVDRPTLEASIRIVKLPGVEDVYAMLAEHRLYSYFKSLPVDSRRDESGQGRDSVLGILSAIIKVANKHSHPPTR